MAGAGTLGPLQEVLSGMVGATETGLTEGVALGRVVDATGFADEGFFDGRKVGSNVSTVGSEVSAVGS